MKTFIVYSLLTIHISGVILIAVAFLIFILNKKEYDQLVISYRESLSDFPMPYSLQSMMGFPGAYPVSCFFLKIYDRKHIFFLKSDSNIYDFFSLRNSKPPQWIRFFCYTWTTSISIIIFSDIIAIVLSPIREHLT